ncbi:MAG: hypothetical protein LC664_07000 [Flavobacteriales bacterium]|nr:hypothetical protein [Flavobacteriales bacterium]
MGTKNHSYKIVCFLCDVKSHYLIISVLFLIACSGESNTSRTIKNSSEKEIKIVIYRFGIPSNDTIKLNPGEERVISLQNSNSGSEDPPDCAARLDSAWSWVEGGGMLNKRIQNTSDWDVETERVKTLPPEYEHTCVFEIEDSDIAQ